MKPSTKCIHIGNNKNNIGMNNPIETSSAFRYRGQDGNVYPRYFNTPNQNNIIEKLCALENGEAGLVFGSGMAAISTTLVGLLKKGDHVVFSQIYGGTFNFAKVEFEKLGVTFTIVNETDISDFEKAIQPNTSIIYVESPSNPLLTILDVKGIADLAKKHNLISVIDNTFATPINQRPLDLGIDVALHSGTKYFGGHSDMCFGAVITSSTLLEKVYKTAINYGGSLNALDCYLIERSLKTLAVRVERHNSNALAIAQFLNQHPKIKTVYYPGLESHPKHDIAKAQMDGFGGMLSFELDTNDLKVVDAFLDKLNYIHDALSLGGVETTICAPALTSHIKMPKAERLKQGITDGTLRLSVGIENIDDLIEDLTKALFN